MKKNHEYKRFASPGTMNQKRDTVISGCEPEGRSAPERSTDRGCKQRLTGLLMAGVLVMGLLGVAVFTAPATARAAHISVGLSVGFAPPPIPVYAQPVCPGPGYFWTPGYWAYDPGDGYYWVPGTWVVTPGVGLLWTPGYWGWGGTAFLWHAGYWGPHVGFYGGIDYGFGYIGVGYAGGYWRGRDFFYNRAVNNIGGAHITNVYNRTVVNNFGGNRISYNGGEGGLRARPTSGELAAEHDRHIEASSGQRQHEMAAHNNRAQYASANHGRPDVAATGRPSELRGANVTRATRAGGPVNPSGSRSTNRVMTAHSNSPSSRGSGTRQAGTRPGQSRSTYSARNSSSRGQAQNRMAAARQPRSTNSARNQSSGGQAQNRMAAARQPRSTNSARNSSSRGQAQNRMAAPRQSRSTNSARNQSSRGQASNLHAENLQRQPQPHRSQPSGGEQDKKRR